MQSPKIQLPKWLMNIQYNGCIIPNGETHDIVNTGANCQVFAYQLLRFNDLVVPDFRSSELWEDVEFSDLVTEDFRPLDLLFFHRKEEAYGAHIAVYLGENRAIHLSRKNEIPVVWEIATFLEQAAYPFLLGGKRFFKKNQ
ncbi:MAG: NlpC/P60 family protein [Chitinophagales bacterium]